MKFANFFGDNLGFKPEDRLRVVGTLIHLADKVSKAGTNVIVSALTANPDARKLLNENLGQAGLRQTRYPVIIWRDREGFMKACACSDSRSWVFIRDDLNAPDRIGPDAGAVGDPGAPLAYPGDGGPESLPYPTLPPVAPTDGASPGATSSPAPSPAPAAPATPPAPRKAPEAKKNDESTFF